MSKTTVAEAVGTTFMIMGVIVLWTLFAPLLGYLSGWIFGTVFHETWQTMHAFLKMPESLTSGMFGCFVSAFGVMIGKTPQSRKEK